MNKEVPGNPERYLVTGVPSIGLGGVRRISPVFGADGIAD
jgi:hypothetical protein